MAWGSDETSIDLAETARRAVRRDGAGCWEGGRKPRQAPHPPRAPSIWGDKTGLQQPVRGPVSQALSSSLD